MWVLTTGKLLYRVWIRRDLVTDKKPELGPKDIQRALRRVSLKRDSESEISKISSDSINWKKEQTEV